MKNIAGKAKIVDIAHRIFLGGRGEIAGFFTKPGEKISFCNAFCVTQMDCNRHKILSPGNQQIVQNTPPKIFGKSTKMHENY